MNAGAVGVRRRGLNGAPWQKTAEKGGRIPPRSPQSAAPCARPFTPAELLAEKNPPASQPPPSRATGSIFPRFPRQPSDPPCEASAGVPLVNPTREASVPPETIPSHFEILRFFYAASLENRIIHRAAICRSPNRAESRLPRFAISAVHRALRLHAMPGESHSL